MDELAEPWLREVMPIMDPSKCVNGVHTYLAHLYRVSELVGNQISEWDTYTYIGIYI